MATTVKYKVPSQSASGADTFSDNLVGFQITDGSSQMTGTNFAIDKIIPEKDSKKFKTSPFSDFLTLDNLKQETDAPTTLSQEEKDNLVKFKGSKDDATKSLFGSLKSRMLVSIKRIISKFPAALYVDANNQLSSEVNTALNITYDVNYNTTTFKIRKSKIYNPFDLTLSKPNSFYLPTSDNTYRDIFSSYTKYVVDYNNQTYDILNYEEPDENNLITIKVNGNLFSGFTSFTDSYLIRPNNGVTEEFYNNLDDLEEVLMNRESSPKYKITLKIPSNSSDNSRTVITDEVFYWPVSNDNWNIKIVGIEFDNLIKDLSDNADLIDDYKSNLMVRFLSSPQLFEYDTPEQKIQSVFQLYGQSFDRVKKYIDNIAFMRNVTYDGVKNLPDILLKNLANNLGLNTVNLFDENTIDQTLYTRSENQYQGVSQGKTFVESEYEFYRRMLVNLAHIYKSKGTKSSINFFLKFLGAPEQLIKIDEYVYEVTNIPKLKDIQNQIYDVLQGDKQIIKLNFNPSDFTYTATILTATTTFARADYPVDEKSGLPRSANNSTSDIFFQKGSGWYDITLDHRTPDVLDTENSILTGRTKTIKTKSKPYSYGEEYFDTFRTLPGLDSGYELTSRIDNLKGSIDDLNSSYILNRKNISIYLDSANGVNFDIYRKSRDLLLTFGSNTLYPQTGVTFAEFTSRLLSEQIPNSNVIRYKKNYITLEDVYQSYISSTGFTPYNITDVHEFINKMSPYWTSIVEQIIPSTTLWTGGNLIQNSVFGRSKYSYKLGCQPKTIIENLYPDFLTILTNDLQDLIGYDENFRGLVDISNIKLYPVIEIDGTPYSSTTYSVNVSGNSSNSNSAKLYDSMSGLTGCTILTGSTYNVNTKLPIVCGYEYFFNPDITKIKTLWIQALTGLIDNVINTRYTGYTAGYEEYDPYLNATGKTSVITSDPQINYSLFTDSDGIDKIKFTSIKYGPKSCTIMKTFGYSVKTEYDPFTPVCEYNVVPEVVNPINTGGTTTRDIILHFVNPVGIVKPNPAYGIRLYVFSGSSPTLFNTSALNTWKYIDPCTLKITGFTSTSKADFLFLDAANCQVKISFTQNEISYSNNVNITFQSEDTTTPNPDLCIIDSKTATTISTYSAVTLNVVYEEPTNFGLKWDSVIRTYTGSSYTETPIYQLQTGSTISVAEYIPNSQIISQDMVNGLSNNNLSGVSFNKKFVVVTGITPMVSIKKYSISGRSQNGVVSVFEVLPTTKLRVYTRYSINDHIPTLMESSFFDSRYPEDLQIGSSQITPCCNYPNNYYVKGDYLIGLTGDTLEVIGVSLDYCTPNMYYNITYSGQNSNLCAFNGTSSKKIITETTYCSGNPILVTGNTVGEVCDDSGNIISYGSIQITPSNGSGTYFYSWYDSNNNLISNERNLYNLTYGDYTVYVTDLCNASSGPITFTVDPGDYCNQE